MAVSRSRVTPRERSRLATFTHAINTTKLTAASRDHRSGWSPVPATIVRLEFRIAVSSGTRRTVRPASGVRELACQISRNGVHLLPG